MAAENAALRVKGVKGLAQKIEVRYRFGAGTSDEEIAGRAIESMKWSTMVPDDKVKVKVQHGWVTLEGTLDWNYQRIGAEDAIRNLRGVAGIINNIELRPRVIAEDVKKSIEDALKRNAAMEADSIHVEVLGTTVSLEGKVKSWGNRKVAEQAAWAIPGVKIVEDHLTLS
jgi:osmotically-inducible protein OsmY